MQVEMDCNKCCRLITVYLQKQIDDPDELEAMVTHLDSCTECRRELEIYHGIYEGVKMLDTDKDMSDLDFGQGLEQELQRSRIRIRLHHRFLNIKTSLTTAAVCAVVLLAIMQSFRL